MNTILWYRNSGATVPADLEERLCAHLRGRVREAYVFGSYGTNRFGPESDVDLILVTDIDLPFVERMRQFTDLYEVFPRLDILVYRPTELERLLKETTGFWASVKASLRPLPLDKTK